MKLMGILVAIFMISACSGKHVIPDEGYAQTGINKTIRVAFDQDGNIYPLDTRKFDWANPDFAKWREPIFGTAYQLDEWFKPDYSNEYKEEIYSNVIGNINQSISDGDTVVVMIHGFNTSYSEALSTYQLMRSKIDKNAFVIEVIWDGLYKRSQSKVDLSNLNFWNKALLYSNYAGNNGVRTLLNGIDKDILLRFVTHSRGAAVAFSSILDPVYDSEFIIIPRLPSLDNKHIKDVKMVLFAPAIGNGHITDDLEQGLMHDNVKVYLGTNKKDIATSKWKFSKVKGDTSLGGNLDYLNEKIYLMRKNISFQRAEFRHGGGHALGNYFEDSELTNCFFWAAELKKDKPVGCFLYR